jgi:hypothetical protein
VKLKAAGLLAGLLIVAFTRRPRGCTSSQGWMGSRNFETMVSGTG